MKIRNRFSISGTATNGLHNHIYIYAFNMAQAKEYANFHFQEAKVVAAD